MAESSLAPRPSDAMAEASGPLPSLPNEVWERVLESVGGAELYALEKSRVAVFGALVPRHCARQRSELVLFDDVPRGPDALAWLVKRLGHVSRLRIRLRRRPTEEGEPEEWERLKTAWDLLHLPGGLPNVTSLCAEDPQGLFYSHGFGFWSGALDSLRDRVRHFSLLGAPLPAHAYDLSVFFRNQRSSLTSFTACVKCEALYELLGLLLQCRGLESVRLWVWGAYPLNWAYNVGINEVLASRLHSLEIRFVDRKELRHLDRHRLRRLVSRCSGLETLHLLQPLSDEDLGLLARLNRLASFAFVLRLDRKDSQATAAALVAFAQATAHSLRRLELHVHSSHHLHLAALRRASVHWGRLERLRLCFGGVEPDREALAEVLGNCPRLEELTCDVALGPLVGMGPKQRFFQPRVARLDCDAGVHCVPKEEVEGSAPTRLGGSAHWLDSCYAPFALQHQRDDEDQASPDLLPPPPLAQLQPLPT